MKRGTIKFMAMKDGSKWSMVMFNKFKNTIPRRMLLKLEGNFRTKKMFYFFLYLEVNLLILFPIKKLIN